jgi:hypothetical protein
MPSKKSADKPFSEKEYDDIVVSRDKFTEDTMIALGLVKKYIIREKLIVVGGMAIDLSLRLKGTHLYADDVLPDYDFYSPQHHIDAYKIAEMLYKAGMRNITVINANHVSTMRVRVNYVVVADVTYIPPSVFKTLPTLIYKDLRIIHPHYQMIDQHRALSLPFENPPWEVITHRWRKDASRYDLLYKYYPLDAPIQPITLCKERNLSSTMLQNQCVGGFVALSYWHERAIKQGFKAKRVTHSIGTAVADSAGFTIQIPVDSHGVTIYSMRILELQSVIEDTQNIRNEKIRMYDRFLDKLPFKIILNDQWELFDSAGVLLSAHRLKNGIYVSNLQNIMLYMLTNHILFKIKDIKRGASFYAGYILAQELVSWAASAQISAFLPNTEVFGDSEVSDSYINTKRMFLERLGDLPKESLQPRMVFPEAFAHGKIPPAYYKFKAATSHLFQFSGRGVVEFHPRVYL